MSDTVIEAEGLGKKFIIGHQIQGQGLRHVLQAGIQSWGKKLRGRHQPSPQREEFWAVRDVSFRIRQGEVVGIIGRNGAGKSTLLKLLSRITEPTEGRIRLQGRLASLLEVGTGFHADLSGRENIYLNGTILGMTRLDIQKKFHDIVGFAEVEKFLDTPVKFYSSGMYVRLAFSVAAHLDPEILVVDEVLAVGDAQFQKKCLGKMEDVAAREGRTVILVSHTMSTIEALCSRCLLMKEGTLCLDGSTQEVVKSYLQASHTISKTISLTERKDRTGNGKVRATGFRILDANQQEVGALQSGQDYYFEIDYFNQATDYNVQAVVSLDITDERGFRWLLFRSNFTNSDLKLTSGSGRIRCGICKLPLTQGSYQFSIYITHADVELLDYIEDAASIEVEGGDFFGTGNPGLPNRCKILAEATWTTV